MCEDVQSMLWRAPLHCPQYDVCTGQLRRKLLEGHSSCRDYVTTGESGGDNSNIESVISGAYPNANTDTEATADRRLGSPDSTNSSSTSARSADLSLCHHGRPARSTL